VTLHSLSTQISSMLSNTDALMSLPKTNLHQILSHLCLKERMRTRECNTTMREAITESDLTVSHVHLLFDRPYSGDLDLIVNGLGNPVKLQANCNDLISLEAFLRTLSQSFYRLRFPLLIIECGDVTVKESLLEKVTAQFDFELVELHFNRRFQQSVIDFALRFNKRIDSLRTWNCTAASLATASLPQLPQLFVLGRQSYEGFTDEQILGIAKQEHKQLSLHGNLLNPKTIRRLMKIVYTSKIIEHLKVRMCSDYFNLFLALTNIREEDNKLVDVNDPNSPFEWGDISQSWEYYLDYRIGYLIVYVRQNSNEHTMTIVNGKMPENCKPSHPLKLNA
ncbi:hypothetical protein PFISCL1PPCAC_25090, partial [Pristionchus fissidentatus]